MFLKGWNSDTARPEKGMHFILLTLLFKDTEDGVAVAKGYIVTRVQTD